MRLFPIPNTQGTEELRKQSEADALWQAIRDKEQTSSSDPNIASFTWLSDAIREDTAQRDERATGEARDSFSFTHERLMQAISASRPLTDNSPEANLPTVSPVVRSYAPERPESRVSFWNRLFPASIQWQRPLRYAGTFAAVLLAVMVGRRTAHMEAPFLPVAEIVHEYDKDLKSNSVTYDHHGGNPNSIEAVLSPKVGMRVLLPHPEEVGAKLVGVRNFEFEGIPTVESHFDHGDTRVAFLQAKAPKHSLRGVTETRVNDRLYMLRDLGQYRIAAWRNHESVLAVVSPLSSDHALEVAERMRNSVASEDAA